MAYEVLARKWRPQVFEDVIGQEHITQTLVNAIKSGRLAHAFLFSGARGVGKTSVARILAKAINCGQKEPGTPCNKCPSCREVTNGSSIDVQEIDGASNRGIDEIRELRENIKFMPASNKYRVYIIDEVHMLTKEAFNALLKTLEEPPSHVKFIFATTEPHKVPVTILSRCQRFDFKRIPLGLIVSLLEKIALEEGLEVGKSGLTIIAREAEGSMRDAESLLDQVVSFAGTRVEEKNITEILGIIDHDLLFETSLAIIEGSPPKCIEIVGRIYNYGYDIKEFYSALMNQFRNLLISLIAPRNDLIDMNDGDREELMRQAELAGMERLQQSLNFLIAREGDLRFTFQPRLTLENVMIKLCRLGEFLSFDEIIKKIEALEKKFSDVSFTGGETQAGYLSDPGGTWERDEGVKKGEEKDGGQTIKEEWDNLLKHLYSKNKAMASILKEWRLLKLTAETLEVERGGTPFSSTYLDEPESLNKFIGYCREFFKRDIEIKIKGDRKNNTRKKDLPGGDKSTPVKKKVADHPQPVQDVLRIFNGAIKDEITS